MRNNMSICGGRRERQPTTLTSLTRKLNKPSNNFLLPVCFTFTAEYTMKMSAVDDDDD